MVGATPAGWRFEEIRLFVWPPAERRHVRNRAGSSPQTCSQVLLRELPAIRSVRAMLKYRSSSRCFATISSVPRWQTAELASIISVRELGSILSTGKTEKSLSVAKIGSGSRTVCRRFRYLDPQPSTWRKPSHRAAVEGDDADNRCGLLVRQPGKEPKLHQFCPPRILRLKLLEGFVQAQARSNWGPQLSGSTSESTHSTIAARASPRLSPACSTRIRRMASAAAAKK